jgi:hypothetical protein
MTIDHRILAHRLPIEDSRGEVVFSLHEVHVTHNGDLYAYNPVPWHGSSHSLDELRNWAELFAEACQKPILWADDRANAKKFPDVYEETVTNG